MAIVGCRKTRWGVNCLGPGIFKGISFYCVPQTEWFLLYLFLGRLNYQQAIYSFIVKLTLMPDMWGLYYPLYTLPFVLVF